MKKISTLLALVCLSNLIVAQIPTSGLTGYWPFNGNAKDSSGNGNNGTVHGATLTTDRFGNCNQAYKFNGVNNYIQVPNSTTVDMNNTDFTIACWIKTYAGDTNAAVLNKNIHTGAFSGYYFATNDNDAGYCPAYKHAYFYVAAGASDEACSDGPVCIDTTWHFLTGVYKYATNQVYFYVDNILQSMVGQAAGTISNTTDLFFGGAGDVNAAYYKGVIDAIRIYQRALSAVEITQLYNELNPGSNCSAEGIEQYNTSNEITLFPNPNNGNFIIEANVTTKQTAQVYDVNGRLVLSQSILGKTSIDASNLNEGIYNLSIISNEGVENKRVVIVK